MTIPDGTAVPPGQEFDKTWRLENCDTSTWDGLHLERDTGSDTAGGRLRSIPPSLSPGSIDLPSVPPGGQVDITAHMRAPSQTGSYRASYNVRNRSSQWVTERTVFVEIVVQ